MMGRSHLVTGICALEHAYAANVWIERTGFSPFLSISRVAAVYSGMDKLEQNEPAEYVGLFASFLVAYFIGVLLPDVDNPNSMLGRFIHIPVEHRTWLHAIYIYLIPAVLGWFVHPAFSWLFFGVLVHLFWDSFSAAGNCWFYKLFSDYRNYPGGAKVKKGHKLKLYHTGEWTEYALLFCIVTITVISFITIRK